MFKAATPLPSTFNVPVRRDARLPTHVLAVSSAPDSECLMVPIHSDLFMKTFRVNILPPSMPGRSSPSSNSNRSHRKVLALPVVPVLVPHVASIPLLLLFGFGLETQTNLLAWRLLPPQVIEEFPNAAAMAQVMARICSEEQLQRCVAHNQGLWKNILALGLRDSTIVELVQTAWNVTADARRIRQRAWGPSPPGSQSWQAASQLSHS